MFYYVQMIERMPQRLEESEIPGPTDATEGLFLKIAERQGFLITEAPMISLSRKKRNKWDKRSTVPDFLIRKDEQDEGVYVEVTENSIEDGHKHGQLRVMVESGLGSRYVQLTKQELEGVESVGANLFEYIERKISSRESR